MTSAPMSARCSVAIGPGRSCVRSRTRMPESGFARIYSTVFGKGCPSIQLLMAATVSGSLPVLLIFSRVLDHLAVVRQLAGPRKRHLAAQFGDAADAVCDFLGEAGALAAHLAAQGHAVV